MKTLKPDGWQPPVAQSEKSCRTCIHRCMDMDLDPYCAAVNLPFGRTLSHGRPEECGPEAKLWVEDRR